MGYLVAGRIKGFEDFFVAGRSLTAPILICSLVSSYYGLDALIGDSGDASREGAVVWFTYGRPYTVALLLTALVLARRVRAGQFLSVPDILAHHYGRPAQVAGAIASFFYALPILSIMGLAAVGQVLFGAPLWVGAVLGSAFAVAYTAMGGAWADALTDTVKFVIMCLSLAVAVPYALSAVGGFAGIQERMGAEFMQPLGKAPALYTAAYALTALSALVEPLFYQRAFAARAPATLTHALLWSILLFAAYDWATTAAGMAGGALMASGVLPSDTPRDQVLLRVMTLYLPVGFSGFFLGGVLATAMSTVDSYLLIAGGNLVYDLYRPLVNPRADDRTLIRYTRLSLIFSAGVCIVIGLYFQRIKEAWNFMATVLSATLLVPLLAALLLPGRRRPLAGTLSAWGGLGAVAVFFVVMDIWGVPHEGLETRALSVGDVELFREYALFFALPISWLGYIAGATLGKRA